MVQEWMKNLMLYTNGPQMREREMNLEDQSMCRVTCTMHIGLPVKI